MAASQSSTVYKQLTSFQWLELACCFWHQLLTIYSPLFLRNFFTIANWLKSHGHTYKTLDKQMNGQHILRRPSMDEWMEWMKSKIMLHIFHCYLLCLDSKKKFSISMIWSMSHIQFCRVAFAFKSNISFRPMRQETFPSKRFDFGSLHVGWEHCWLIRIRIHILMLIRNLFHRFCRNF